MTNEELAALDCAVARAEGDSTAAIIKGRCYARIDSGQRVYMPTRVWDDAGRLLVKYQGSLGFRAQDKWYCVLVQDGRVTEFGDAYGETPQIAICRAVIALSEIRREPAV